VAKFNEYLRRMLKSKSGPAVLELFNKTNNVHKELTESFAMLEATKRYFSNLENYTIIVSGDGSLPRTGLVMALYTKAHVISIDPALNRDKWFDYLGWFYKLSGRHLDMEAYETRIEDFSLDLDGGSVIFLHPHSHGGFEAPSVINYSYRSDIAMPCCREIPHQWATRPAISYVDDSVLSPKARIYVWQ
jgi:hypothetical protein